MVQTAIVSIVTLVAALYAFWRLAPQAWLGPIKRLAQNLAPNPVAHAHDGSEQTPWPQQRPMSSACRSCNGCSGCSNHEVPAQD